MARPVVFTNRNEDVLVDVEWSSEALCEDIHDVVIAIRTVIEFNAKRVLPLLGFENMFGVWSVKNETFEVEFTYTAKFWARFEVHIRVVTDAVGAFKKADLGIKVRPDFAALGETFEPAVLINEVCAEISLS